MCRWWSGCINSWGARRRRSRRTAQLHDCCSSGRSDAGPFDSLRYGGDRVGDAGESERCPVVILENIPRGRCVDYSDTILRFKNTQALLLVFKSRLRREQTGPL